jgi:hypothetical protein
MHTSRLSYRLQSLHHLGASALDRIQKIELKDRIKDRVERSTNELDELYNNAIFERNIARRQGRLF